MVKIYHNPRCSKSRQALEMLEAMPVDIEVITYLEKGLTTQEILKLSKLLNKNVIEFIRTKEDEFKNLKVDWNDNQKAATALSKHPKLLERPIVINGDMATVARPPELLKGLFN